MGKISTNKKNIDKLYDLYYKNIGDITSIVTRIINSLHVMKKSDYAKNSDTIVDKAASASCGDNNTIRFGIDSNGKWGYIKDDGADTVIPFKTGGGSMQDKTASATTSQQVITPDSGYDGLSSVTINAATKQSKTVSASTSQQVITPDSGYYGLSQVTVNAATKQSKTVTPTNQQQVITPDSGYYGLSQVTVNAAPGANLQNKTTTITPVANWSGSETSATSITPDSGYDGMSQVNVKTPMIRDNCLVNVSTVDTPSTVYNGDTSESNNQKLLRVAPSKTGMAYTNSYLYIKPSSYMGDAQPSDVLSGKTFTSSSGIQQTGTNPGGGVIQQLKEYYSHMSAGADWVVPSSGYDGIKQVKLYGVDDNNSPAKTTLWTGSATTAFSAQTITLSNDYTDFYYIRITYNTHKNKTSSNYMQWIMPVSAITAMNSTSTNIFALAGRAISSDGATSGSSYGRLFRFASTRSITFGAGTLITSGTGSTSNNVIIPVKVEGIL